MSDKQHDGHPTPQEVWDTLSPINVNEHTEDRMGLTYLSWVWAVTTMKENYPQYTVEWHGGSDETPDVFYYRDGSAMVACTVRIGQHVSETCWLPVMNPGKGPRGAKYESRINPTSRDISDAKQRCLVKCFAMLGLGLYIYAGEDLPSEDEEKARWKEAAIEAAIKSAKTYGRKFKEEKTELSDEFRANAKAAIRSRDLDTLNEVLKDMEAIANQEASTQPEQEEEQS